MHDDHQIKLHHPSAFDFQQVEHDRWLLQSTQKKEKPFIWRLKKTWGEVFLHNILRKTKKWQNEGEMTLQTNDTLVAF